MKFAMSAVVCLLAGLLLSAEAPKQKKITLDEAREKIAEIVKNPEKMGEITAQLSAADQKQFMLEINKAVATMPGSNEQKTAKFLTLEREALLAAEKGNLQPLVAAMFKSVTLESLTVLAERYAEDLFNRSSDATKTFTDEQFTEIASSTVKEVAKECESLPDAAQRDTLAIYLFEKSSNDTIPDLEDRLLEAAFSDEKTRQVAKNEWLAEAKSSEEGDRFSSLLASADAGRQPNVDVVLNIAGPQLMTAVLNDLAMGVMNSEGKQVMPVILGEGTTGRDTATASRAADAVARAASDSQPKTGDPTKTYNPQYNRDQAQKVKEEAKEPEPEPEPEPKPYLYQD